MILKNDKIWYSSMTLCTLMLGAHSERSQSPALLSLLIACKINMGILKRTVNTCIYLHCVIFQAIEAQEIDCTLSIQHHGYKNRININIK
jgi:hypothetical protein